MSRTNPYIREAMSFWRNISPTGAAKDFVEVWSDNPYRWRVLAISIAATTGMMIVAIPKSERAAPEKPKITYITSFKPGRTDDQIIRSNIENQIRQDRYRELMEKRVEFRKDMYRELGRATGLDVDSMEREIRKEEAEQKRAEAAKAAAVRAAAPQAELKKVERVEAQMRPEASKPSDTQSEAGQVAGD